MTEIDRAAFVPKHLRQHAYEDIALPIGSGQTISQPTTVAFMFEQLAPESGMRVLDIGFGSGWTTALLASIVGEHGEVHAIELVLEVFTRGRETLEQFNFTQVRLYNQSGVFGLPKRAPFDRILVSAAADEIPSAFLEQLAEGGILVIPIINDIIRVVKESKTKFTKKMFPGFVFVPLVST